MSVPAPDPFLPVIIAASKDLLKFKIIQNISTGDKTYDSLLQTLLLSIMTAVFGWFSLDYFKRKFYMCMYRKNTKYSGVGKVLSPENVAHWSVISKDREDSLVYKTWMLDGSESSHIFTQKFCSYFVQKVGWRFGKTRIVVFDTETFQDKDILGCVKIIDNIRSNLKKVDYMPMFITDDSVAGCCINDSQTIMFYSDDSNTLKAMLEDINTHELDGEELDADSNATKNGDLAITMRGTDEYYTLYRDRCLDKFVSRHKPRIKNLLDGFIKANQDGSDYGGFGTYNLGFMLHGRPGTGKTFLIKSICNYLKRNAYIVDMRKIKNKREFENLFYGEESIKKYVFVLDEFDCVQGAIRDRGADEKAENSSGPSFDSLHEKKMDLLKLLMTEKTQSKEKSQGDNPSVIQEELIKLNKEIADRENALSLDTMLTVLDGMVEMRGRVIIATTNFIDHIDKALLRDGRFDMKVKLDAFNADEIRELYRIMFTGKATDAELRRLETIRLAEDIYTPTQLINMAIAHGSLSKALDIVKLPEKTA